MTAPFTPEEIRATRVLVAERSQTSWSPAILANERRWLATVEALEDRLERARAATEHMCEGGVAPSGYDALCDAIFEGE